MRRNHGCRLFFLSSLNLVWKRLCNISFWNTPRAAAVILFSSLICSTCLYPMVQRDQWSALRQNFHRTVMSIHNKHVPPASQYRPESGMRRPDMRRQGVDMLLACKLFATFKLEALVLQPSKGVNDWTSSVYHRPMPPPSVTSPHLPRVCRVFLQARKHPN